MSKKNITWNAFAIAVFTVIRVVMFSYFPNLSDKTPYIPLGILLAAFAVLTSLLLLKVSKSSERKTDAVLLLIFADSFFTLQNNSAFLAVAVLWEICALLALTKKKTVIKEAVLIAVSFVSALILPYSVFSYVLLAAFICFMVNRKNSPMKAAVCSVLAIVGGAAGFAVHNTALKGTAEFNNFINTYTLGTYNQSISLSVVSIIPAAVISAVFIKMLVTYSKSGLNPSGAAGIKNRKKEIKFYIAGIAVLYAVSAVGLAMKQFDMYLLINQIVPVIFVAMILNKDTSAEKALERINKFLSEHSFMALIIFIFVFAVQIYCLNKIGVGGAMREYIGRLIY